MHYINHTLTNGLRIVFAPNGDMQTATIIIMTGTGSRYENERENGLAHFLEHMFFKGTEKRPSARAISEELDGVGAAYNAFTSKERTAYWAKTSTAYFDTALDVVSDLFLHSTLPSKEITKERGAVIQEIDMYEDMPMRTIDTVFDAMIFGAHPLGRTILGPKENIRAFTRADFNTYHARNYTPENTVVVIAGTFDEKKALAKITKEFRTLKRSTTPTFAPIALTQDAPRVSIKEKKTDQTQLMLGVPAYPYLHPDEYALTLLTAVLGSGMSSRLFLEVREKRGLAYSVHAWTDKYPDVGYFAVQAGVEHGKLEKAVSTILAELRRVKKEPIPAAELKKAKSQLKGSAALALETSDEVAENAATSMINIGRVRPLEEIIKGIEAVTAKDIQRVANDIFKTNKLNLAIIGPHASSDHLKLLLKV